jgi:hypothetical protein
VARHLLIAAVLALLIGTTPAAAGGPTMPNERARAKEWKGAFASAERYARSREGRVSVALIDDTGILRRHRSARTYPSASVVKAMLLVAYLKHRRGRALTSGDRALVGPMITRSDNGAASSVLGIVGYEGLNTVARRAGMKRFETQPGWSDTQITAADQARLFVRIDELVPWRHRRYARYLLSHVIERQRWGIPHGAPDLARLFFKGGWRPGPTGWLVHQVALVEAGGRRASLAVLTDHDRDRAYGAATIRGVAERALRPFRAPLTAAAARFSRK